MTLGSILSIFVAFNIDDEYQSTALLKYSEDDLGQSFFNTNSALSGLSSIAGINLNAGSYDPIDYSIEKIKSREFLKKLLDFQS